ncbi:MAG: GntR family transcriptional regulator [Microcella sp.]
MRTSPISRVLLSDQVYDRIRSLILDGSVAPGERLVESEIARSLSVSQAPVREAIKKLVHEGLVTSVPRKGSYVTEISTDEFAIARQLRATIEKVGAVYATENFSNDHRVRLERILSRMETAVELRDWATFRELDLEFHSTVIGLTGQAVLTRLWAVLEPLLLSQRAIGDPSFIGDPSYGGELHRLVDIHRDLLRALQSGDPVRAAEEFHRHASGAITGISR